eukprot:gnl/MRDRNA2_/MRDRNA2_68981_c0_seq1.p1 gnl/MRDRNA2_/MRDRNA2_68981_c0~~gnl/MRDRNA2_/MRDRNA2_68981_c0_seq1.p1  ORF type:complete len:305 (+),score=40.74 gnl/MRDRNA2_/MRDRNA2_68981_c0_seq1:127-1041(+)
MGCSQLALRQRLALISVPLLLGLLFFNEMFTDSSFKILQFHNFFSPPKEAPTAYLSISRASSDNSSVLSWISAPRHAIKSDRQIAPGQISLADCNVLYEGTKATEASILEIGAYQGRSASCIASALRDSGKKRVFDSVDFHISSKAEYFATFGPGTGANLSIEHMEKWWVRSVAARDFAYIVEQGGTEKAMKANLAKLGLTSYVHIVKGNFKDVRVPPGGYSLIYGDHLHDVTEIRSNFPGTLAMASPNAFLLLHDCIPGNSKEKVRGENLREVERILAENTKSNYVVKTVEGFVVIALNTKGE